VANGEFLSGLSSGIFGRLEELDQRQKAKDSESKLQLVQLLSGLADKVETQSLPLLMKHLGDVMGVKGRLKGFWRAFGGLPDTSIEEQYGTKLREITSGMVGPETARQSRESFKDELLQPYRQLGTRPRRVEDLPYRTPPTLADRLILRDPRREKLEDLETQYEVQLSNNLRLQEEKSKLDLLEQQERDRVADKKQMVQMRLKFNQELGDQLRFYRSQGVKDPKQARRLALNDYSDLAIQLGIPVPPLSPTDNQVLDKVQSQINRLNQLTLKGMGGGSESGNIQTWIELSDGSVVPADKVNFDRMPPGVTVKRMFTTMNGQPVTFGRGAGGGGAFTLEEASRQIEIMRKAGRSTQQINSAIDEMVKDNPKMKSELEKLKAAPAPARDFKAPVFSDPEGMAFGAVGGETQSSQEEIRRRIELDVMKSEVNWLRSQLDYAEKQLAVAPGVVQRESLQREVNDLKGRLKYAEGELNKKETGGGKTVIPPPTAVKRVGGTAIPPSVSTPTPTPKVAHPPTPVPFNYIKR
jgi:hypothetical protein